MTTVRLGKTEITVNKNGFGALPIQRITKSEAVYLLHKAFDGGINFYDTARAYTDSEEKLGEAFDGRRDRIRISSKTGARTAEDFWKDLEVTLRNLKTDHLDIYQFHNPSFCPKPGDESGLYDAALEAKKKSSSRMMSSSFTVSKRLICFRSTSSSLGTGFFPCSEAAISLERTEISASESSSTSSFARARTGSGTPASLATWMP